MDDQFYYKAFVSIAVCRPLPKFTSLGVLGGLGVVTAARLKQLSEAGVSILS